MDRFEAMRVFIRVAELQSFTKAAEGIGLPKATVSTAIQELEASVHARLLNRTTRQVQLTQEGQSFLERAKDVLADLDDIESMFRIDASQIEGKIRIDMTVPMARDLVIPQLHEFLALHPKVEVELSCTDRRVDLIREGLDCVIRSGNVSEAGVAEKEIGEMTLANCASPGYLKKLGTPKSLEDLKHHQLIHYAQVLGNRPDGFEYFDGDRYREIKMNGVITVNNTVAYQGACVAGFGIAQIPRVGIKSQLASGELVEVLPRWRAQPMKLKLVYPQRRLLARRVRVSRMAGAAPAASSRDGLKRTRVFSSRATRVFVSS